MLNKKQLADYKAANPEKYKLKEKALLKRNEVKAEVKEVLTAEVKEEK